ncbi:MAG: T9SS type A sorting domain-containing protein [Bacteroidota bacterium]
MKMSNLLVILLFLPFLSFSQLAAVDLSFFPYYNQDLMEDLDVSSEQMNQINDLYTQFGEKQSALYDALLFREDLNRELQALNVMRDTRLHEILTEDQKLMYQAFREGAKAEHDPVHSKRYKDMYLELYDYLKIKGEQAQLLADFDLAFNDGKWKGGRNYKAEKRKLLQSILTEKQWNKYERKGGRENFEVKTTSSGKTNAKKLNEWKEKRLNYLQNIYLPQRAMIRHQLDEFISEKDWADIAYLKKMYDDHIESFDKKIEHEVFHFEDKEVINRKYLVENVVHQNRDVFSIAKRLAIKFDDKIDAFQTELKALETHHFYHSTGDKIIPPTEKVELARNIAFLIIATENANSSIQAIAQSTAAPMPATNNQSLEFKNEMDGEVSIELLNAEGKVIKTLFKDQLIKGTHKQTFDLSFLEDGVFFYRISTTSGSSVLKSMKVK